AKARQDALRESFKRADVADKLKEKFGGSDGVRNAKRFVKCSCADGACHRSNVVLAGPDGHRSRRGRCRSLHGVRLRDRANGALRAGNWTHWYRAGPWRGLFRALSSGRSEPGDDPAPALGASPDRAAELLPPH